MPRMEGDDGNKRVGEDERGQIGAWRRRAVEEQESPPADPGTRRLSFTD